MGKSKDAWQTGLGEEIEFWRQVILNYGPNAIHHEELLRRVDPERPIRPWIAALLPPTNTFEANILDIGAGPASFLGWKLEGRTLNIKAVDALAATYKELLATANIIVPVPTEECEAENLLQKFSPSTFDIITIRNAIDHCHNPLDVCINCIALIKKGGSLFVETKFNEGESEHYKGLHQWNIEYDHTSNKVILWNDTVNVDIGGAFSTTCELSVVCKPGAKVFQFWLTKYR